jgi:hypothetical protein
MDNQFPRAVGVQFQRLGLGCRFDYSGPDGSTLSDFFLPATVSPRIFGKLVCALTESDALFRIIRNFKEGMYASTIAKTRN